MKGSWVNLTSTYTAGAMGFRRVLRVWDCNLGALPA